MEKLGRGGSGQVERKAEGWEGSGALGEWRVEGDMYDMCV